MAAEPTQPLQRLATERLVKVFGWCDNERGYSCRLVDLTERLGG